MLPAYLRATSAGTSLELWIQPRASRTEVVGERDGRLKISLAAPPVDGAANEALVEALAGWLGVPRRDVELAAGAQGRKKRVLVRGLTPEATAAALAPLL